MLYAHLYIPGFSAWAFQRQERMEGPLVVVEGGRVVAAGSALRRIGVTRGVTAERVQALVPEAVIRLRDASFESAVWEEVLQTIIRYTPFLEPGAPGYAFFRPPDALTDTRALARTLEAQVGLAASRNIALLASLKPAAGTVLAVEPRYADAFLDQYPIEKLLELDFEEPFVEQLGLFGYRTLGKARALSLRHLRAQFGHAGERLHELLHAESPEKPVALYRPSPALVTVYEFEHPVSEPGDLLPALDYLIQRTATRLGTYRCQRMKVSVQCLPHGETYFSCRVLPEPLASPARLMHTARTLLMERLRPDLQIEALTLELSALRRPHTEQTMLFARRPEVKKAVQSVHRRFPGALKRAVVHPHVVFPEERTSWDNEILDL